MRVVQWDESLQVGHEEIDRQHRELFEVLDRLREAVQNQEPESVRLGMLAELIDCTQRHFVLEEGVMNQLAYADLPSHHAEHQRLMAQVRELQDKVAQGDLPLSLSVFQFLYGWLARHIEIRDKLVGRAWQDQS